MEKVKLLGRPPIANVHVRDQPGRGNSLFLQALGGGRSKLSFSFVGEGDEMRRILEARRTRRVAAMRGTYIVM